MSKLTNKILLITVLLFSVGIIYAATITDTENIQHAIDSLPAKGGTIQLKAGTYILLAGLHINRSNVTINGERGTLLKLANNVNQPVILIGTDKEIPNEKDLIKNIHISNIEIDGNRKHQTSEFDSRKKWIRNNGIDVRTVDNLWINNVDIYDTRSGGIVISWKSKRIFINNSSFHNNYYDGLAFYDSKDIQVNNFLTYENTGAGISLDNKLKHVTFSNGSVKDNNDVGIFIRDSEDLKFHNLMIFGNKNHGVFMSHTALENYPGVIIKGTGVRRLFFSGCAFLNNKGYGLLLASPAKHSPDNTVISSLFSGNSAGGIQHSNTSLYTSGNVHHK
ncbi:MAG: right-handed parallel beta-helix repeat-containing protein [bacterium]|nr:right-handed parallel beta-helix repeat-containing protein [bacterium]